MPRESEDRESEEECEVWCHDCNCYLWSESIYENEGKTAIGISCPHFEKCMKQRTKK